MEEDVRYTTLDLFAGAGGASLGLRDAGFHHALCVEWDEDATATLWAADFPAANADVRELDVYKTIERVELLWASPPCQAFSTAGQRKGAGDDWNGWPWTLEVIDHLREQGVGPRYVVCENVQGLTYHQTDCTGGRKGCAGCYWEGWIIPEFKKRFAWVGHTTLDAAGFGVPQHRRRVFLVAGDVPIRWPVPTHGPPNAAKQGALFGGGVRPYVTVRDVLNIDTRVMGISCNPYRKDEGGEWIKEDRTYKDITDTPAGCVSSRGPLDNQGPFVVSDGASVPGPGSEPWRLDEPSATVTTTEEKGTRGKHMSGGPDRAADTMWRGAGVRRLTWQECAALQSFPVEHPFQGKTKKSLYRQVGNAVPPPLSRVLGQAVKEALDAG